MKKTLIALGLMMLTIAGAQAQVNKTVKEESTVKRVVTKQGSAVEIKETKDTKTQSGAVIVEDNNKINQEFSESSKNASDNKILVDEINTDAANEAMISNNKMRQEALLEASKKELAMDAEKRRMELEQKHMERMQELAENRARLEARPKGMSKLKKN